jgi:DNA primase large subunit
MALRELRKNGMMNRMIEALERGEDIGHYGRLVFAMVARHFMDEEELVELLQKDKDFSETQARALVQQVQGRDYNPPRREKILQWQQEQAFQMLPENDPDEGNVYRDLEFPPEVYEHIQEYYEAKAG